MKRYNNCENVLLNARACAEAVIVKMRKEGKENCDVSQADMQHFASSSNCTISKFKKDFVKSRQWVNLHSSTAYFNTYGKFPNKMKLSDALSGTDCMIKRAFDVRQSPIIFTLLEQPNESNIQQDDMQPFLEPALISI